MYFQGVMKHKSRRGYLAVGVERILSHHRTCRDLDHINHTYHIDHIDQTNHIDNVDHLHHRSNLDNLQVDPVSAVVQHLHVSRVQIQPGIHVLDHPDRTAPTAYHELNHTDLP